MSTVTQKDVIDLIKRYRSNAATAPVSGYVRDTRQIIAGTGLTGGGDLTADRTLAVTGILATFYGLSNTAGWLHNNGAGVLAYTTPSKSDVGLGNVENIALSTWAGSANITTLGTITSGVWNGSVIGAAYIADLSSVYQPLKAILTSIGNLSSSTTGLIKLTNGTASLDATAYGTGSVTSVAMTVPTGLTISGSPIATSGTLGLSLTSGYSIPTTANQTNWSSAYTFTSGFGTNYPDLTAIEALTGTAGFLKKTAANTWALDNSTYLTGNQTITLSGDISGSGATAITTTLPTVNSNVGTYQGITVNAKGQVTAAANQSYLTGNQSITLSGDVTGSGTTAITATLANSGVTAGTYGALTVNAKGLATSGTTICPVANGGTGLSALGTVGTAMLPYTSASSGFLKWSGSALSIDATTYTTYPYNLALGQYNTYYYMQFGSFVISGAGLSSYTAEFLMSGMVITPDYNCNGVVQLVVRRNSLTSVTAGFTVGNLGSIALPNLYCVSDDGQNFRLYYKVPTKTSYSGYFNFKMLSGDPAMLAAGTHITEDVAPTGTVCTFIATPVGISSLSATSPIVASASTGAVTLTHATSGVTAGTYGALTVNTYGHATGGTTICPVANGGTGLSALGTVGTAMLPYTSASSGFLKWSGSALSIDNSAYLTSSDLAGYLPLTAGSGKALTGNLYGIGAILSGTADNCLQINNAISTTYAHAILSLNSLCATAGYRNLYEIGYASSSANTANFGFCFQSAGSTSNFLTMGLYGYNDLLKITAAGVATFSGSVVTPALTVAGFTSAGLVKTSAAGVLSVDNTTYLSSAVTSLSATTPIVASASTGAVTLTHATSGVTAGTYKSLTVNAYGHVTGGTNPTTRDGFGITDAAPLTHGCAAGYIPYAPTTTTWGSSPVFTDGTNISIGKTAPGFTVDANGSICAHGDYYTYDWTEGYWLGHDKKFGLYRPASNDMQLITNANVRMTIDFYGNVGINTTSPTSKLHVVGSTDAVATIYGTNSGSAGLGVLGEASAADGIGLEGYCSNYAGLYTYGVKGYANGYGVYGEANYYGVYGKASNINGYGVYSEGSFGASGGICFSGHAEISTTTASTTIDKGSCQGPLVKLYNTYAGTPKIYFSGYSRGDILIIKNNGTGQCAYTAKDIYYNGLAYLQLAATETVILLCYADGGYFMPIADPRGSIQI